MSQEVRNLILAVESHAKAANPFNMSFESELEFAYQSVISDAKKIDVAIAQPFSLQKAFLNAFSIGITLSPHAKLGYIVVRQKAIQLDVSYRGLIYLATSSGSIVGAKPELVYEGEQFEWSGSFKSPTHKFNPFGRPDDVFAGLVGGYCEALLPGGHFLCDYMSLGDINKTRALSRAGADSSPWVAWPRPMILKTILKRSSAYWPYSDRLSRAIDVLNQHEGIDTSSGEPAPAVHGITPDQSSAIRGMLGAAGMDEQAFCQRAGISTIEELDPDRFEGAMKSLRHRAERLAPQQKQQRTVQL